MTPAVEAVLKADTERWRLLEREKVLVKALDEGEGDETALSQELAEVRRRQREGRGRRRRRKEDKEGEYYYYHTYQARKTSIQSRLKSNHMTSQICILKISSSLAFPPPSSPPLPSSLLLGV